MAPLSARVWCTGPGSLACEPQGGAMAVGWAQAMPVGGVTDAYYPVSFEREALECPASIDREALECPASVDREAP